MTEQSSSARADAAPESLHPDISERDHTRGPETPGPVLTVYGDYECPVSARLWQVLRVLRTAHNEVHEAFRHFPLTNVHPHAFAAAQAAEAASDQGMFWPMHDRLFEHQPALEIADLSDHAIELGLEIERFDEDVAYGTFADAVREHQRSGISSGVTTTPAVFVDGRRVFLEHPEDLPGFLKANPR
jgi:protein-disulfide isomerase